MTRESLASSTHRIALLATGDEITNGDILNSNSQSIAQKLFRNGMHVGIHMSVSDNISEIEKAITYLLQSHDALIITGGLGPTSDDLTRFALSKAINCPLVFNENTWESICERFRTLGYKNPPPEGNRQQALFPSHAIIISNSAGTAAGCMTTWQNKFIFMLPGPPSECLPMLDTFVIPSLIEHEFKEILFYDNWLLFGVSESVIAEQLDHIAKPFDCMTGYRLAYPYIEFKIYSQNAADFKTLSSLVEKVIAPYLISDGKQTAATMLQNKLEKLNYVLSIQDNATAGLLESIITTPKNYARINFHAHEVMIEIHGLTEYWQEQDVNDTNLEIIFPHSDSKQKITKQIPLRGRTSRVKQFAVEFICQQIYQFISLEIEGLH